MSAPRRIGLLPNFSAKAGMIRAALDKVTDEKMRTALVPVLTPLADLTRELDEWARKVSGTANDASVGHADTHLRGGSDAILSPQEDPAAVQAGVAVDRGDATTFARADHVHAITTGAAVGLSTANAEGSGAALARAAHTHKRDLSVASGGTEVGIRYRINFVASASVSVVDNAGADRIDVTITPGSGYWSRTGTVVSLLNAGDVVGIGTAAPKGTGGRLHVVGAGANADTDWYAYSPLVVENNTHNYINVRTPNTSFGGILFSDPDATYGGAIDYNHATEVMSFYAGVTSRATLSPTALSVAHRMLLAVGSVSAPAYSFTDEPDVGIYLQDSGTEQGLNFTANGVFCGYIGQMTATAVEVSVTSPDGGTSGGIYVNDSGLVEVGSDSADNVDLIRGGTMIASLRSTGLYIALDCSALTFTDRTPWYEGDALADLRKIKGSGGGIDHGTLPAFARRANAKEPPGRDLGAMVTLLTVAVQALDAEVERLKKGN